MNKTLKYLGLLLLFALGEILYLVLITFGLAFLASIVPMASYLLNFLPILLVAGVVWSIAIFKKISKKYSRTEKIIFVVGMLIPIIYFFYEIGLIFLGPAIVPTTIPKL